MQATMFLVSPSRRGGGFSLQSSTIKLLFFSLWPLVDKKTPASLHCLSGGGLTPPGFEWTSFLVGHSTTDPAISHPSPVFGSPPSA